MAPDKIYIQAGAIFRTEKTFDNDVCYIRKDALLEWAKKELSGIDGSFGLAEGARAALLIVIEKLNSM